MAARIMVMAGGTGGHVFPALAVAEELRKRGWEVTWLGTPDSFESRVVPQHDFPMQFVKAYRLRGQGIGDLLLAPLRLINALRQAWQVLRHNKPQVVLGMGGFVTGPGGLVSIILRLPLVVHEQNALPGLTNRWLSRAAAHVLEAFPGSFPANRKALCTGNPVRQEIVALADMTRHKIETHRPVRLLVLGGSLGAAALNETLPRALSLLHAASELEIRHQAGAGKAEQTSSLYEQSKVIAEVTEFVTDMAAAYKWADLVVCRAGALTVSELAIAGVGAILVPYPHAVDDHQTVNAGFLEDAGAAVIVQQAVLSPESLAVLLGELISDSQRLFEMATAARKLAQPEATVTVADICEEALAA